MRTSPAGWRRSTSLYLEATLALLAVSWVPEAARQTRERGGFGSNRTRQAIKQWRWIAVGAAEPRIRRQARGFRGGALAGLGSGLCCCRGRSGCWALEFGCAAEARTAQLPTVQHGGLQSRMCPSKSSEGAPEGLVVSRQKRQRLEALGKRIKREIPAEPGERRTQQKPEIGNERWHY